MGISKELYLKISEEHAQNLSMQELDYLHNLGAEWRYYDQSERDSFKSDGYSAKQRAMQKIYESQNKR